MKKEYKIVIHADKRIKKRDVNDLVLEVFEDLHPNIYKYVKLMDIEEKEIEGEMFDIIHI
jgi:hypothetical protein